MIVAVTGASGFLGTHLAEVLRARGHVVRGVVRTPGKADSSTCDQWATADISHVDALTDAFRGVDAIVANAALATREAAPYSAFLEANVAGVEQVFTAAIRAGVPRIVLVSSVAVHRLLRFGLHDQSAPLLTNVRLKLSLNFLTTNWRYALSKAEGERRAWELAAQAGLQLTVVRPGPIYGPRDHKLTANYRRLLDRRWLALPTTRAPHVHAGDVAAAIAAALERPNTAGKAYLLGGPSVSPYEVLTTWRELAGRGPTLVPIPLPVRIAFDDGPAIRELGISVRSMRDGLTDVIARS